jgi:energy-coupling factor transporter ATP-binding protein EcfA2
MSTAPVPESKQADSAAPKKAKHLTDLTIENFRGLRKVELHGLGAVNLIVGQNNTGKTSLLEAIMAVVKPESLSNMPAPFRQRLLDRGTDATPRTMGQKKARPDAWLLSDGTSIGELTAKTAYGTNTISLSKGQIPPDSEFPPDAEDPSFFVDQTRVDPRQLSSAALSVRPVSVRTPGPDELVTPFANAVRSPRSEQDMEAILNKMDQRIRSVRLDYAHGGPLITVDVGLTERVPLSHAGQGVYRIVSILSQLLGQKPDICLIDELENGVHYSVLPQLWRGISEISSRLGIQVFVTTHSRECLEAATRVFVDEDPENTRDFAVIQLMRVRGEVVGRVLDEKRVAEALDNDIELR